MKSTREQPHGVLIPFRPSAARSCSSALPAPSAALLAAACELPRLVDRLTRLACVEPQAVHLVAEIVNGILDEVDP